MRRVEALVWGALCPAPTICLSRALPTALCSVTLAPACDIPRVSGPVGVASPRVPGRCAEVVVPHSTLFDRISQLLLRDLSPPDTEHGAEEFLQLRAQVVARRGDGGAIYGTSPELPWRGSVTEFAGVDKDMLREGAGL